eukprot:1249849-Rhodomonas_salina.2
MSASETKSHLDESIREREWKRRGQLFARSYREWQACAAVIPRLEATSLHEPASGPHGSTASGWDRGHS